MKTTRHLILTALCTLTALALSPSVEVEANAQNHGITGLWDTQWGKTSSRVELRQVLPDYAVGTFQSEMKVGAVYAGGIAGDLKGGTLAGRWTDSKSTGRFKLLFSTDGETFTGHWGRDLSSDSNGGVWTGKRR